MRLLALKIICIFCAAASIAQAEDLRRLTSEEIKESLIDRTAVSTDPDWPYRQFFRSNFETIFAEPDKKSTLGDWRTTNPAGELIVAREAPACFGPF